MFESVIFRITITIVLSVMFGMGIFFTVVSTEEGNQHKEINCWKSSYAAGKTTCNVVSWEEKHFWADVSQHIYHQQLQVTFVTNNGTIITLLAPPFLSGNLPNWLGVGKQIDCYFPKANASADCVNIGFATKNIWINAPPSDIFSDAAKKSLGIGMACFFYVMGLLICVAAGFIIQKNKLCGQTPT